MSVKLFTIIICLFILASCSTNKLIIPDEPYDPTDPNRPPHLIQHGDLEYSNLAREVNTKGKVSVELTVEQSGTVTDIKILDRNFNYSAVYLRNGTLKPVKDIFDEPLVKFYKKCRYSPGYHNGIPVGTTIRTGVTFTLAQ